MSELFGIPTGLRAYQDDQIKLAELGMRQQTTAANVGLVNAQARNLDVDNARQAEELAMKKQEMARAEALRAELGRIAQGGSPAPDSPAGKPVLGGGSQFDAMIATSGKQVEYLMRTGNVKEATELLARLSNGVKDLAQARQATSAAAENEYDVSAKRHEGVAKTLSGVTDQTSYDAARLQLQSSGLLSPEDLAEMPAKFNPLFVRSAIAGTAAAKQKADLARESSRTAALNANSYDAIRNRKLVRDLEERKFKLSEERAARLEKQGVSTAKPKDDKPLPPATVRELEIVRGDLKRLGIKTGDSQADLVSDIAEQVKTLVDSNPGLSRAEASARIVSEMQARGELTEGWFGSKKYEPKEGSVTMPLPTPRTAAELKKGNYYVDAEDGLVKLFDGKGFTVASRRKRADVGGTR